MDADEMTDPHHSATTAPPAATPRAGARRWLAEWVARAPGRASWRGFHLPRLESRRPVLVVLLCSLVLATVSGALAAFGGGAPWRLGADLSHALGSTATRGSAGYSGPWLPPIRRAPTPPPPPTPTHAELLARWNGLQGCEHGAPKPLPRVLTSAQDAGTRAAAPREVALTFDDGPTPYTTPAILAALRKAHAPATFFVMGQYARQWPELIRREWAAGYAIGLHTWDHPNMTQLSPAAQRSQFTATLQAVRDALGAKACIWFWRPPYGAVNGQVQGVARAFGLTTITWDDDTVDWSRPGVDQIVATALAEARPGAIILMHDGPAQRDETAAAIPRILAGLKARGLTPVTLPQLLADYHVHGVSDPRAAPPEPTPPPMPQLPGVPSSGY